MGSVTCFLFIYYKLKEKTIECMLLFKLNIDKLFTFTLFCFNIYLHLRHIWITDTQLSLSYSIGSIWKDKNV